jgi:STE24 endopeptidase
VSSRLPRPATVAAVAVAAALWALAAYALWDTTVPGSARLPDLEASPFFGDAFLERSETYERFLVVLGLLATAVLLVVFALYAKRGHRLMRESAAGRIGTGMLLGMLGFAVAWLAELPFGLAAVWWQRRYDVSEQSYLEWALESFLSLGGVFLFVCAALAVAMALAGVLRRWWWAAAVPAFAALALLYAFVTPYLIPETKPLEDPELVAATRALEERQGVGEARLRVQEVERFTSAPNAIAAGFGPTATIFLWDTLLDDRFSQEEVRAVIAHEVAHLAHRDTLKGVGWLVLFLVPATALVAFFTRGRGGLARPEAVPVALLVLVVLQLLATPLFNVVSRHVEEAADWSALEATRRPEAQRGLQRELSKASLSRPDPPAWTQLLYGTHPTPLRRIEMTYAWEGRQRREPGM